MKVYQINVVCGSGSTGKIAADISLMLENNGHQCRIAYGRGTAPEDLNTFKMSTLLDNYVHAFLTRLTDRHGLYSKRATKHLTEDIKKYNPDIIHIHNIHGYYVNYELLFSFLRQYEKPIIWTMHDCWAFTGHCAHYDSVECMKWQEECLDCPNTGTYPSTLCKTNTSSNFKKKKTLFTGLKQLNIVTPSAWLKEQIKQSFLSDYNCIIIPNGVDLDRFKPRKSDLKQQLGCANRKLILGVASVWTNNKGFQDFLELRQKLDQQYAICMVGLNERQIKSLPEGIIGIRRTQSIEELAQYYSAADVFLNLTYEDTFPTTNIEALACGTPVITYRTGGSIESIDESCGTYVERGDIQSIVEQIGNWAWQECGEDCCKRAQLYNKDICYEAYMKNYFDIIK